MTDTTRRILIVDDERAITSSLALALRDLATIDTAPTTRDALALLASHAYDAALVDLVLGDGDDPAQLHDALTSQGTPVVLISGRGGDALESTAKARGWTMLAKPFSFDVLHSTLARLLGVDVPERADVTQRRPTLPGPPAPIAPDVAPTDPTAQERAALPERDSATPTRDAWLDRLRVTLDRAIYAGALWIVYHLALVHLLDAGTGALILLVAGVRPHNLFDAARAVTSAPSGGGRAALLALFLPIVTGVRSGSWLAR